MGDHKRFNAVQSRQLFNRIGLDDGSVECVNPMNVAAKETHYLINVASANTIVPVTYTILCMYYTIVLGGSRYCHSFFMAPTTKFETPNLITKMKKIYL